MPDPGKSLAERLQFCTLYRADDERLFRAPACVLLLDGFDRSQLVLPGSFKGTRYETVLGLDRVILASCPFGLIAGPFPAERPLPLQLLALLLQVIHRGESDRNLIRREGIEHNAFDKRINRQGSYFLTQHAGTMIAIKATAIDRIVAARSRVVQRHSLSTTAADRDALQQSQALAGHASLPRFISVDVVRHSPLVGHELLPANVTRMSSLQANRPVRDCHLDGSHERSRSASARILLPTAVNVSPSIGRIVKDIAHARAVGLSPDHLMRRRPEQRSNRQRQPARAQKAHHPTCALQLPELGKDEVKAGLHLVVRVEHNGACPVVDEPGRQRQAELAARCFLPLALMEAHPDLMKLRLTHDSGQAEEQPVMVSARIIEALAICDQNCEHRAELKQLVPIAIVAGKT